MSDETFQQQWLAGDRARHRAPHPELTSQLQALTQRNYELTVLVTELVQMLADAGAVDSNVLLAKVEGQLEDIAPPVVTTKPGVVHCAKCGAEVDRTAAQMTLNGLMCARCA